MINKAPNQGCFVFFRFCVEFGKAEEEFKYQTQFKLM